MFSCYNLNGLTAFNNSSKRHLLAINFSTNATVANIGVNGICKINTSGIHREPKNFSFRREDINLIWVKINLDTFQKFFRMGCSLDLLNGCKPLPCFDLWRNIIFIFCLVFPMCCNAAFRNPVHCFCSDLNLNWCTTRSQ